MEGVSSYGLTSMILDSATRLQTAVAETEVQEASGLVGETYGALGSQAGQYLSFENEVSQAQTYVDNASTANDRVQAMYSAVGDMISLLTSLRSTIDGAISDNETSTTASDAQGVLSELASLMNTQQAGLYLFSGGSTTTAPVDVSSASYTLSATGTLADTSYYKGDDYQASVTISGDETIAYGVTADNSAFEEALRVANTVAHIDTSSGSATTALQDAYDLATSAMTALSDIQGELSITSGRLEDAKEEQTIYMSFVQNLADDISNVDTADVAVRVSSYQTQLEAAYSAIAEMEKLSLVNYL